ncbi:MAG TPA: hypothetical protein VGO62_11090 [Myxococcota bacterium]|jgi:hypothetical protein
MSDLKSDMLVNAGKDLAKRALSDLGLSDEEKQQRDLERSAARKKTLIKYGLIGVFGIAVVLSLMSVLAHLWMYALAFLVVAGIGTAGFFYVKPKVLALKNRAAKSLQEKNEADVVVQKEQAVVDAASAKKQKLEDELAALKRRA